jgi:hypothetical protein
VMPVLCVMRVMRVMRVVRVVCVTRVVYVVHLQGKSLRDLITFMSIHKKIVSSVWKSS